MPVGLVQAVDMKGVGHIPEEGQGHHSLALPRGQELPVKEREGCCYYNQINTY